MEQEKIGATNSMELLGVWRINNENDNQYFWVYA